MRARPSERATPHPFGKVPALIHDGRSVFETLAILVYADRTWPSPRLIPERAAEGAAAFERYALIDHHLATPVREALTTERLVKPRLGLAPDESAIAASLKPIAATLAVMETQLADAPWFGGEGIAIADLLAFALLDYVALCPEDETLLAEAPNLKRWRDAFAARPSAKATAYDLDAFGPAP